MLSGITASLVALPTWAQLPPLDSPDTIRSQGVLRPQASPPSTVALETYALGPGDQIRVEVLVELEIFEEPFDQIVLLDGSLTLPWVGKVDVAGLNPIEAEAKVAAAYSQYIRNPRLTFQLLQPRPLRVGIVGEINRPGGYTLQVSSEAGEQSEASESRTRFWPSLTQAIITAGGITRSADVRSVQIKREGVPDLIQANLWDLVESGNLRQDVLLRDGDQIIVPTAQTIDNSEVIALANTTFAPATITVNVVGEVESPGSLSVPPDTLLNQAVLTAGGFNNRARTSRVELIRLNPNGNVSQQSVSVNLAQDVNDEQNPVLQDGDTIIVGRSGLAATSDTASLIFSPLTDLLLGIFGIQ
ncbi:SLBB domain-containing protein [Leptolyngbya cf. ectocarpi LEGE 11479]|uniref:SLBB domain-containing protein n=2 Tax=Leptolyngbya ectocarpi TaxID=1202 RepID=A0A928ZYC4_LEPEC|nr:SLBB domain-containing protein [Leptolyngbya cf. ectocarpi LEGE 11479]